MALAVSFRFDFVDAKGKPSFTKVRVPTGFTISGYTDFGILMAQLLANLSTCRMTGASFCVGLDLSSSTIKAIPSGLSDIAQKALFGFSTVVSGLRTKMKLPAISESKMVLGSDVLDLSDVDVAGFISAMETGVVVTGGTIEPTDLRGNNISILDYARELFRKK